jgi:hypothetical protein
MFAVQFRACISLHVYGLDPQITLSHPYTVLFSGTIYGKINCLEIAVLYLSATCIDNNFRSEKYVVKSLPITFEMRTQMNAGFHINFPLLCNIKFGCVEKINTTLQCEA